MRGFREVRENREIREDRELRAHDPSNEYRASQLIKPKTDITYEEACAFWDNLFAEKLGLNQEAE